MRLVPNDTHSVHGSEQGTNQANLSKMGERTLESLQESLKAVRSRITGRDILDAGIVFGKDPLNPLTERAITNYLSGNGPDAELAENLLQFFEKRALEYEELEARRLEEMKEQRSSAA